MKTILALLLLAAPSWGAQITKGKNLTVSVGGGGGSVIADAPILGNGTSGDHLRLSTNVVTQDGSGNVNLGVGGSMTLSSMTVSTLTVTDYLLSLGTAQFNGGLTSTFVGSYYSYGSTAAYGAYKDLAFGNTGTIVPSGMILLSTSTCPTGWNEYTGAYGRFMVAMPAGGTAGGTVGATPLGDLENKTHTHTFTVPAAVRGAGGIGTGDTGTFTTGTASDGDFVPYFQFRLCSAP